jgi:hypothetical protein
MDEKNIGNFSYVQMSLVMAFNALTELQYLNKARSKEEVEMLMMPPFQFYAVTLQYMFVMEYVKLLERNYLRFPGQHFASLEKLSLKVLDTVGTSYQAQHDQNMSELETIRKTDFFNMIRERRDKKFAHTDGNYAASPMAISALTDDNLSTAAQQLSALKAINDRCTGPFDYEFVFQHPDNRTDNFIKFTAVFKRYYFDHYFDANQNGYGLHE